MAKYILALDQGTTSSRTILFDKQGNICSVAQQEFTQIFPKPGWVEHDPNEIWATQSGVMTQAIQKIGAKPEDIAAIGITNQRETTVVWDKNTGKPVYNAIVWQCRRTAEYCDTLKAKGFDKKIKEKTGLVVDAYFSGTKIRWILENVPGAREKAEKGELLFGNIDTWLLWKLTGGKVHATDYSNASRTMVFNINTLQWDDEILKELNIPKSMLPTVKPSSGVFGETVSDLTGRPIPVAGIAGDQQAALFGQCCFEKGEAKNTYGTGCFLLMNTGAEPCQSRNGLITTIAASLPASGKVQYALEGSVFVGGAVIQWLRDEMRFFTESADAEYYAGKVEDTGGVYLVPAFTGLGSPYWDMYARGCIVGITRGTKRAHIIRAAEESIAYQSLDLIRAMEKDLGIKLAELKVDGGASRDALLMQFQADIMEGIIRRPVVRETTALGAAYLAGLATGFWKSREEVREKWRSDVSFSPMMETSRREKLLAGWHKAVQRSCAWAE